MKYNILVGGSAGQGMDTFTSLLQKIFMREGYYVFSNKDYMSRVRGGHNFIQLRFGTEEVATFHPSLDVIVAFDEKTVELHGNRLKDNGVILCDDSIKVTHKNVITLPMMNIAKEIGKPRVYSTIAMGAVLRLFGMSTDKAREVFEKKWDSDIKEDNLKAIMKGYELVEVKFQLNESNEKNNILISGNQAIAFGALAGGVSFYSGYPMTPSTSVMTYLSKKQREANLVVVQAEDEIAAINMAIGASFTGARSMTGTSGGGLSLMTETLGLVDITETPLVVLNVQRPGPATGLPTRTEQSDLSFVLSASHGEIPRMVLAVRNAEDAFYQTVRALNLADKYQMLVIILGDQYLADAKQTIPEYDLSKIEINRYIAEKGDIDVEDYKRYKLTESGISPRVIPGSIEGVTVLADSHEHDEYGGIDESSDLRNNMMKKRMRKLDSLREELIEPEYFGGEEPEILLLGWGSTYGSLKESVELLKGEGIKVGALVFGDIYPLPTKLLERYSKTAKTIVNVEQNFTGQLAKLIRQETGISADKSILKYDGRQISGEEVYTRIKEEVI